MGKRCFGRHGFLEDLIAADLGHLLFRVTIGISMPSASVGAGGQRLFLLSRLDQTV
jgi:hypothetical protein